MWKKIVKKSKRYSFLVYLNFRRMLVATFGIGRGPDFMIIGVQKAGTTSLFEYLKNYGENFRAPLQKETRFFTEFYKKGENYYKAFFPFKKDGITGDSTPTYLFFHKAVERIAKMYPDMKFVILLRNPIDRAYSQYNFVKYSDRTPATDSLTFEEAIDQETTRVKITDSEEFDYNYKHYSYASKGLYCDQLVRWFEQYPKENFLIFDSEELFSNTKDVIQQTADFVGVKLNIPDDEKFQIYNKNPHDDMKPVTREKLRDYFQPHNEKLFALLGREFDWK